MPKHKFNLVGNTFNYEDAPRCSVWGKESKFTEWVDEGGDGTFYIDAAIGLAFDDPRPGPKYAWILESAAIGVITQSVLEPILFQLKSAKG